MDEGVAAELDRLRARAYGPAADLAGDPGALERLQELEDLVAAERMPPPAPDTGPEAAPGDLHVAASGVDPDPGAEPPAAEVVDPAPRRRVWRIALPVAWAMSLVIVGAIVAGHTFLTTSAVLLPVARSGDARQVAVIHESTTVAIPRFFGSSDVEPRRFADFAGLTVIAATGWADDPTDVCMLLMRTSDYNPGADYINGPIYTACGAGQFPPSLSVRVSDDMPDQIRERFPVGSSLQFVLDGDRVGVFSDAIPVEST